MDPAAGAIGREDRQAKRHRFNQHEAVRRLIVKLFTLADVAGNWGQAQKAHFADGGVFDQTYQPGKK